MLTQIRKQENGMLLPSEPHSLVLILVTKPKHYLISADMKEVKVWAVEAASQTWEVKYKQYDTKVLIKWAVIWHLLYALQMGNVLKYT